MIETGLDRLLEQGDRLRGRHYGILSHAAAVSRELLPIHLALVRSGLQTPARLFGAEHGFYGVEQDMVPVADTADTADTGDATDPWTGAEIVSFYGDSKESLRPQAKAFEGLDLLVIDLQDVGSRYYTYAATAVWAAEVALAAGCEVWVLDRPNPLGGEVIEGNLRQPGYESFIGAFEMPVRHGLTLAELVLMGLGRAVGSESAGDGLTIWRLEGWRREAGWETTGRAWVAPSPNIPTVRAAEIFPGGCLLEATEFSEGRGTARPFQLLGAPGVDAVALADRLERAALAGTRFSPVVFKPQYQKHAGRACSGVEWFVDDAKQLEPYRCGVEILRALREVAPEVFAWRREAYEFEAERAAIDLLTGDHRLREALDEGGDLDGWIATWRRDEDRFREARRPFLLYRSDGSGSRA